jgi:hypothetical protein
MKAVWQGRMVQTAARYGEHAPMAAVCCNACRTCTTSSVIALAFGGMAAVAAGTVAAFRRITRRR